MKTCIYIIALLSVLSCSTAKFLKSKDNSSSNKVTTTTERKRPSLETTLELPKYNYKDTTIYTVNRVDKTIISSSFDSNGNQKIDCIPAAINERLQRIEENQKTDVKVDSEIKREFNPQYLIYALIVFLALLLILVIVVYVLLKSIVPSLIKTTLKNTL